MTEIVLLFLSIRVEPREGGKWKGKVMPISLELSKSDPFFLSMKSQVYDV